MTLSFQNFLMELKKLNLPRDQFAIFGSGPLAIRNVRDVQDLDIVTKPELWVQLALKYKPVTERKIQVGDIEIFNGWKPWFDNANELIDSADIIDGIRYVKLKYLLEWKKAMGREKDLKDIPMIEKLLEEESKKA